MQAVQPVARPISTWLLRQPFLRRFAYGKSGHAEVKHHDAHHDAHAHDHVRHFEGPGEGVPFPTYPLPKLYVGLVYWAYVTAPMTAGVLCLRRAKASK